MFLWSFSTCLSGTCSDTNSCVKLQKRALEREFEHDGKGCDNKNAHTDLQALRADDNEIYIVYDIICDIVYDISLHIVYDIVQIYDIVYLYAISYTI